MTTLQPGTSSPINGTQKQQLRDLNSEFRDTQTALNQAQICLNRAAKFTEESYHRRRRQILANGHDLDE